MDLGPHPKDITQNHHKSFNRDVNPWIVERSSLLKESSRLNPSQDESKFVSNMLALFGKHAQKPNMQYHLNAHHACQEYLIDIPSSLIKWVLDHLVAQENRPKVILIESLSFMQVCHAPTINDLYKYLILHNHFTTINMVKQLCFWTD